MQHQHSPASWCVSIQHIQQQPGVRKRIFSAAQQHPPAISDCQRRDRLQKTVTCCVGKQFHPGCWAHTEDCSGFHCRMWNRRLTGKVAVRNLMVCCAGQEHSSRSLLEDSPVQGMSHRSETYQKKLTGRTL